MAGKLVAFRRLSGRDLFTSESRTLSGLKSGTGGSRGIERARASPTLTAGRNWFHFEHCAECSPKLWQPFTEHSCLPGVVS